MNIYDKELLDKHYDINIFERNKQKLLSGGVGDSYLANAKNDNRMSVALLIRISPSVTDKISDCITNLKAIDNNIYYYSKNEFHITVMDILKGESNRSIPQNLNEYINCIKECASEINPFKIKFEGLTASDNAIMVKGYYEYELQKFRVLLRNALRKRGLALEERYETISSHITIARIHEKLYNPNEIVKYIEQNHSFGIMEVNSFELSFHNWYDTKKEALSIINLQK